MMRITHAVTLVSPDGSYGGPTRVALNQLHELQSRGHNVELIAGARGYDPVPESVNDVPVSLHRTRTVIPRSGFVGCSSPGALGRLWGKRNGGVDVAHLHLARDLVMLPLAYAALIGRIRYVVQPHGMIVPRPGAGGRLFDRVLVRRLLHNAEAVFYLTDNERQGIEEILDGESINLVHLRNGVPLYPQAEPFGSDAADTPEVLFLARLQERKRPADFVSAAKQLISDGVDARFNLVGPDGGEGQRISEAIEGSDRITWEGPVDPEASPQRLRSASIYVLPSVNEPYPMSVLEAMSVGVPVIIGNDCGLAPDVRASGAGLTIDSGPRPVAQAVAHLIDNPDIAREMGRRGRELIERRFTMASIAAELEQHYGAGLTLPTGSQV